MGKKLTKDEVKHWEQRIQLGLFGLEKRVETWNRVANRYANRDLPAVFGDSEDDQVRVNMLFSNIQTKMPNLFFQNPDLGVLPKRSGIPEEAAIKARATELYYLREDDFKGKVNRAIFDSLLRGFGCLKMGYTTRSVGSEPVPEEKETVFGKIKGKLPKGKKSQSVKETSTIVGPPRIIREGPTYSRVSPRNIITHPDAYWPADEGFRWLGHISSQTLEQVRYNTTLDKKWRDKLQANRGLDPNRVKLPEKYDPAGTDDPDQQYVLLIEIWDMIHRRILTFADGNYELGEGRNQDWIFEYMDGYPFEFLVPKEMPDEFGALTEEDPIIGQLEELDRIRTLGVRHMKRANRKYLATSDISEADKRALQIGEDCVVITVEGDTAKDQVVPIADAPIPMDTHRLESACKEDINVVSGVAEFDRNRVAGAATATEAYILEEGNQRRAGYSQDQVNEFLLKAMQKHFKICQQWLPQDLEVKITGTTEGSSWRQVSPKDIAGDFDFEIIAGSTSQPNLERIKADTLKVYEMLRDNPTVDITKLTKLLVSRFPHVIPPDLARLLVKNPQLPNPMESPEAQALMGGGGPSLGGAPPAPADEPIPLPVGGMA